MYIHTIIKSINLPRRVCPPISKPFPPKNKCLRKVIKHTLVAWRAPPLRRARAHSDRRQFSLNVRSSLSSPQAKRVSAPFASNALEHSFGRKSDYMCHVLNPNVYIWKPNSVKNTPNGKATNKTSAAMKHIISMRADKLGEIGFQMASIYIKRLPQALVRKGEW